MAAGAAFGSTAGSGAVGVGEAVGDGGRELPVLEQAIAIAPKRLRNGPRRARRENSGSETTVNFHLRLPDTEVSTNRADFCTYP